MTEIESEANLDQVVATLDHILFEEDEPIVVAINAGWGEGKTYFWKNEYSVRHNQIHMGYVSVFGMESINDIRQHVVAEALSNVVNDAKKEVDLNYFQPLAEKLRILSVLDKTRKNWNYFAGKIANKLGIPESLSTQILEDEVLKPGWIICLDDIERLSTGVNIDAFLGYINELKDLRHIKVVLIYSDSHFDKHKSTFIKYHEKVIDRQLPFIPDIRQRLQMVFDDYEDIRGDGDLLDELARRSNVLKLKNIRLLNKLRYYYSEIINSIPGPVDQEFKKNILLMLLLFICIHFRHNENLLPGFNYLDDYSDFGSAWSDLSDDSDGIDEQENIKYNKLLSEYGYSYTDDIDKILIEFVTTDLLDSEKIQNEYEQYVNQTNHGQLESRFSAVWKTLYHGTLKENTDTFCSEIVTATKNYMAHIPLNNLDEVLLKLDALGKSEDVAQLIRIFSETRFDKIVKSGTDLFEPIKHQGLSELYESAKVTFNDDTRPINEVIDSALQDDIPSQNDRKRLAEFSTEDYFNYFTSTNEPRLTLKIKALGTIASRFSNPDDYERKIERDVREAAQQIAAMNPLNRLRMESMGLVDKE